MSFLKKLGDGMKVVGKSIKDSAQKAAIEIQKHQEVMAKERKKKKSYIKLKKQILQKLTLTDFKKILKEYGVEEPDKYDHDPFTGEKTKKNITERNLYGEHIMYNISLEQLIEIARRKKIQVNTIIKEKNETDKEYNEESKIKSFEELNSQEETDEEFTQVEVVKKKVSELDLILEKIDQEFEFDKIKDENELEGLLDLFLKLTFKDKGWEIKRQYNIGNGKIDIVVDKKYGIELKIAESNKIIENLVGQVLKYIKVFGKNKVAVVILITPKTNMEVLDENIEHIENMGAKVLTLDKGTLRRRKNNVKTFKLVK